MNLVLHPVWPSLIIAGTRVRPGSGSFTSSSQAERVLVSIVKTTYAADDPTSTPATVQVPIALMDEDFAGGTPPVAPFRQESDLAIDKPKADIVVLGSPAPPQGAPSGASWTERVRVGTEVMSQPFNSSSDPATFGWQTRTSGVRLTAAGDCQNFDPDTQALPAGFSNTFFNGAIWANADGPSFTHPAPGSVVFVESEYGGSTSVRRLYLPPAPPHATVSFTDAAGNPTRSDFELHIDTVIFDKTTGRFTVTWRGAWPIDAVPADRYLSVSLS